MVGARLPLLALLVLATAAGALPASAADGDPSARIVHRAGDPSPGSRIQLQVEVTWEGRPEQHLPGPPKLETPRGASVRIGRTGSRFDGGRTRWWTDVVVQLPDDGGPWTFGPASVQLRGGGAAGATLTADPIELGEPAAWRALLGQGIGNGAVVGLVLLWLGWRYRSLAPAAPSAEQSLAAELLSRARDELAEDPLAALGRAVEVRLALADAGVDNAAPPTSDALRARHDAARYGGEAIERAECQGFLTQLGELLENEEA